MVSCLVMTATAGLAHLCSFHTAAHKHSSAERILSPYQRLNIVFTAIGRGERLGVLRPGLHDLLYDCERQIANCDCKLTGLYPMDDPCFEACTVYHAWSKCSTKVLAEYHL